MSRATRVSAACSRLSSALKQSEILASECLKIAHVLDSKIPLTEFPEDVVAASVIYLKGRNHGEQRTLAECSRYSKQSRRDLIRCYKCITAASGVSVKITTAHDIHHRICTDLKMTGAEISLVKQRLDEVTAAGHLDSRSPDTVVAAVIYELFSFTVPEIRKVVCTSSRAIYQAAGVLRKSE